MSKLLREIKELTSEAKGIADRLKSKLEEDTRTPLADDELRTLRDFAHRIWPPTEVHSDSHDLCNCQICAHWRVHKETTEAQRDYFKAQAIEMMKGRRIEA